MQFVEPTQIAPLPRDAPTGSAVGPGVDLSPRAATRSHADRFFRLLAILLCGYALEGKPFAYIGVAPLYIGEVVMMFGVFALAMTPGWDRLLLRGYVLPLLIFMAWCLVRTIPYVSTYGADAVRDGAIWIWGLFALTIGSLIAAEPARLEGIIRFFARFAKWFLLIAPIVYYLSNYQDPKVPTAPWANIPIILVKGGDVVVNLTGILAAAVLLGGISSTLAVYVLVIDLGLAFTGRAAMVTFGLGFLIVAMCRPRSRIIHRVPMLMLAGLLVMFVLDIHVKNNSGDGARDVSAEQIVQNVTSIFSNKSSHSDLDATKAWRLAWWDKIISYTFDGKYFWTGKGFGINLADDDGFQVNADDSLRSPHNGHLTLLARAGVPGLSLWIACQSAWAAMIVVNAYVAHRRGQQRWSSLFIVLIVYWSAFMTNAAFDVYLESPVGGIWMWSVYGVGLGSLWVYRNCPEALAPASPLPGEINATTGHLGTPPLLAAPGDDTMPVPPVRYL